MSQPTVISLLHGSGGSSFRQLLAEVFLDAFGNAELNKLNDAAICAAEGGQIAFTTDSYVVHPRFFPGGDIGRLAVCGTVNDLSMSGARPAYLSCGMIIEAGFSLQELRQICYSMAKAAEEAGVKIVTGDTKVVEKGSCDGLFINTAGVGTFPPQRQPLPQIIAPGDAILLSGTMADHGLALLAEREKLDFQPVIQSDVAPLNGLVEVLLSACPEVHALRDATRGGVAGVLNEWADANKCDIQLEESLLPLQPQVRAACELLGLDPLEIANEAKFVAAIPAEQAEAALAAMHTHPLGKNAAIIGKVSGSGGLVAVMTPYGSARIVEMPDGEQLPRIC